MDGKQTKSEMVQGYKKAGFTHRKIAKLMGFASTSTVSYYASNVHQHRLSFFPDKSNGYWYCTNNLCERRFKS